MTYKTKKQEEIALFYPYHSHMSTQLLYPESELSNMQNYFLLRLLILTQKENWATGSG